MNVPTFTHTQVSDKDGSYSSEAQHYNDVLNQQMQDNLSEDGIVMPSRSTDEIEYIVNPANANKRPDGTMWYDATTNEMKALINGEIKVFTMT